MAPSLSPFHVPALDVRTSVEPDHYDPSTYVHVFARDGSSSSGAIIGLSVLLAIVGVGTLAAVAYIFVQRKQLLNFSTIRVLYNVNNLTQDADPTKQQQPQQSGVTVAVDEALEKGTTLDSGEKLYTIDLSDDKPRLIHAPSKEPPHVLPPPSLRRKHTRTVARQRLRIVIPSGVAIPDVELVTTATPPNGTPTSGMSSAVSRAAGGVSRRNTARTPRSALSSAITAISTAAIGVVHRKEKVEPVYQSNGWAPATIVYLPRNPRDTAPTRSPSAASGVGRKMTRKSLRRAPLTASTITQESEFEKAPAVA